MGRIISKIQQLNRWFIIAIISVMFTICAIAYFQASAEITGNMGIGSALEFLLKHPKEYGICLSCGAVAKIMVYVMTAITIVSILELVCVFTNRHLIECIIKIVASGIGWYIHNMIIINFWILLITILLIFGFLWVIFNN